jgi:hypothetical protein
MALAIVAWGPGRFSIDGWFLPGRG